MSKPYQNSRGVSLVEIVIGVSLFTVIVLAISGAYAFYARTAHQNTERLIATLLLEETVEVVRFIRDNNEWASSLNTLMIGDTYYLDFDGNNWSIVSTQPAFIDGVFDRYVVIDNVYRDANDNIAPSGTLDTDIKQITASVSWLTSAGTTTRSTTFYLANLFDAS